MRKTVLSLITVGALTSFTAGQAEDLGYGLDLSANVSVATDYVWRGDTQTDGAPAVQGGLDLVHSSGFYVGNWNSNVDGGIEMDAYAGFSNSLGILGYDAGAIGYFYPKQDGVNFYELYAGLSLEGNGVTPAVKAYCDPEHENQYAEGTLDLAVGAATLTGRLGYNMPNEGDKLYDWGAGVSFSALTLDWGVQYTDKEKGDDAVTLSVGKSF
jgi:uncharacterized protein (TIGR02001 family)